MMKMVKGTCFIRVTVRINVLICLFVFDKSDKESIAFLILPYGITILVGHELSYWSRTIHLTGFPSSFATLQLLTPQYFQLSMISESTSLARTSRNNCFNLLLFPKTTQRWRRYVLSILLLKLNLKDYCSLPGFNQNLFIMHLHCIPLSLKSENNIAYWSSPNYFALLQADSHPYICIFR